MGHDLVEHIAGIATDLEKDEKTRALGDVVRHTLDLIATREDYLAFIDKLFPNALCFAPFIREKKEGFEDDQGQIAGQIVVTEETLRNTSVSSFLVNSGSGLRWENGALIQGRQQQVIDTCRSFERVFDHLTGSPEQQLILSVEEQKMLVKLRELMQSPENAERFHQLRYALRVLWGLDVISKQICGIPKTLEEHGAETTVAINEPAISSIMLELQDHIRGQLTAIQQSTTLTGLELPKGIVTDPSQASTDPALAMVTKPPAGKSQSPHQEDRPAARQNRIFPLLIRKMLDLIKSILKRLQRLHRLNPNKEIVFGFHKKKVDAPCLKKLPADQPEDAKLLRDAKLTKSTNPISQKPRSSS